MIESILVFLIYLVIIGLVFWTVVWVLNQVGIPVPPRAIQLVGVLLFLLILLYFFQSGFNLSLPRISG